MGVVNIEWHGLFGVLIFLATVALLLLLTLVNFIADRVGGHKSEKADWSKYLFRSGLIFLLFDAIFFVLVFLQGDKTITKDEGILFDCRMTYIWIPFHIIGYFLTAVVLRYIRFHKDEINKKLDKWR